MKIVIQLVSEKAGVKYCIKTNTAETKRPGQKYVPPPPARLTFEGWGSVAEFDLAIDFR